MKHRQDGFTLLEVLIALSIFSLLGLACHQLLEHMLRTDKRINEHELQLRRVQRAISIFERDLIQAVAYPVNGSFARQALEGDTDLIRFVRGGWQNASHQASNDLLVVSHHWNDGRWERQYLNVTDSKDPDRSASIQMLLRDIKFERLRYIDDQGNPHPKWPIDNTPLSMPDAIELQFAAPGFPDLRRVILLPGSKRQDNG